MPSNKEPTGKEPSLLSSQRSNICKVYPSARSASWMIGTSGTLTSHKSRAALSNFFDAPSSLANSTWSKSVPSLLQGTTPCVSKRTPRVLQVLYPLKVLGVVLWSKCFRDDDRMILGGMSQFFHSSDSLRLYNHPPLVSSCRCFAASSDHFQSLGASI